MLIVHLFVLWLRLCLVCYSLPSLSIGKSTIFHPTINVISYNYKC